jgi:hypothetical protein
VDRRRLVVTQLAPAITILAALILCAAVETEHWPQVVLLGAVVAAPLWAWAALRVGGSAVVRPDLVTTVNAHLTALVGYAIGAVLLLIFIGWWVWAVVLVGQLVFSATAARRTWKGETVQTPPALIRFVR